MTTKKLPITACYIAGAEAHRIGKSLESVAGWVSEIVVVLNFEVSDGTDKIVESFGGKVFREPWKNFIAQKNSAAEKANQTWILGLDADEIVSEQLKSEITALFESPENQIQNHGAFQFPRCTYYCERWIRHGDWYPDRVTRLWKRGSAKWIGIDPHASLQVNGTIGRLKADLLHYSNESIDKQITKIIPYSQDFVAHGLETNRRPGPFDLFIRPTWRFLRAYVFRLGFLDGWPGYYIASLTAFSTLTRYIKIKEARLPQE
ncbi:MAG: wcaA [Verrucomicrobiales bacterium]|nr:wcaA [Verrucomicrobiales bacterium]